jgi:N-acetylmuramoyl-L-alanine amidase
MTRQIIERPSANHDARAPGAVIDMLILHYTGMRSGAEALDRLCDPTSRVSAHYLVEEDGTLYRLVDEESRAWHAGISYWAGETDINGCSIGIEIVNPGHEFGYRPFPEAQMDAVIELCHDIQSRHVIPPKRILGHSDVAPDRKQDPGELFDWRRLADEGVGVWPDIMTEDENPDETIARSLLTGIGYNPDTTPAVLLTAFQRRFRPALVDGALDAETLALLRARTAIS